MLVYGVVAVLFVVFYLVLFPRALPAEFTLVPQQATVLSETGADKLTPGGSFFTLGPWEGYWNREGALERARPLRPGATAWAESVAWYDAPRNQVVVEGLQGVRYTLAGEQFPYWSQGRLFTFDENRLGLKAWDADGKLLWRKQFSSLITSLDTSANLTVVGTLDGKVQIFGNKGNPAGGFQPGGSRLPVIYNVGVSPLDGTVLVLAGVDPKRFVVLERGGSEFRPVFHKPLKETRPWSTPLGFVNRGALAYYQNERGLAFLDPRAPDQEFLVPVRGDPLVLEALPSVGLVSFLQQSGPDSALRVASPQGASLLTLPYASGEALLQRQGQALMVGLDQTLLRFEVKVQ